MKRSYCLATERRIEKLQCTLGNIHVCNFYKCGARRCDLCLTEKYVIAHADQEHLLNKRTESISKCRHRNKCLIKNVK